MCVCVCGVLMDVDVYICVCVCMCVCLYVEHVVLCVHNMPADRYLMTFNLHHG